MNVLQRWKQTSIHNKALVLTSVLVAFGTLFYAGAAVFQIRLMQKSASQSSTQMDRFIAAADRMSNSIQNNLQESQRQTKAALDATIESARNDQRAWIGHSYTIEPAFRDADGKAVYLKNGEHPNFAVRIENSGKSIAKNVIHQVAFKVLGPTEPFVPTYRPRPPKSSVSIFYPGTHASIGTGVIPNPITQLDIDAIIARRKILYLFGYIKYDDAFGRPHHSNFCLYLDTNLTNFLGCSTYNDAN